MVRDYPYLDLVPFVQDIRTRGKTFKFEYFSKVENEFENNFRGEQGRGCSYNEETIGKKSPANVSLNQTQTHGAVFL
jgi:hypothetical protein